jgi:hypothetical protein
MLTSLVDVLPLYSEPRKHLVWFVNQQFGVHLKGFDEVFVDSTFGTNSLGAHFYVILGQENGWFVPLAYMLLEKKDKKEKTNDTSPDVTASVNHLFATAQSKGLSPRFVHVDKCFSEINAARVKSPSPCLYVFMFFYPRLYAFSFISPTLV